MGVNFDFNENRYRFYHTASHYLRHEMRYELWVSTHLSNHITWTQYLLVLEIYLLNRITSVAIGFLHLCFHLTNYKHHSHLSLWTSSHWYVTLLLSDLGSGNVDKHKSQNVIEIERFYILDTYQKMTGWNDNSDLILFVALYILPCVKEIGARGCSKFFDSSHNRDIRAIDIFP